VNAEIEEGKTGSDLGGEETLLGARDYTIPSS